MNVFEVMREEPKSDLGDTPRLFSGSDEYDQFVSDAESEGYGPYPDTETVTLPELIVWLRSMSDHDREKILDEAILSDEDREEIESALNA